MYIPLDSWAEDTERSGRHIYQGGLRRVRLLMSTGGSNYYNCKNCGKKNKKKSRRQRHLGDDIFGGEEEGSRLLLVLSDFGLLPVWGDQVDMKSDLLPNE